MTAGKSKAKQYEKTYLMKNQWIDFKRCSNKKDSKMPGGMPRAFSRDLKTTDVGG